MTRHKHHVARPMGLGGRRREARKDAQSFDRGAAWMNAVPQAGIEWVVSWERNTVAAVGRIRARWQRAHLGLVKSCEARLHPIVRGWLA